jgi:hypothetical protein
VSGCSVLFVIVRQLIPEDLAAVAPGPELARVLAGIELSRLSGYDCVEVLKARYRRLNHERAQLMAAMVEVGLYGIGPDDELPRRAIPDEFSADEVRAALVLTRRAAHAGVLGLDAYTKGWIGVELTTARSSVSTKSPQCVLPAWGRVIEDTATAPPAHIGWGRPAFLAAV